MRSGKTQFARRLLDWYDRHRRDLPWRPARGEKPNAYHVLVSEIMLQQTQVRTVIPYFLHFVTQWPSIRRLAAAEEQTLLRAWQGLGYYSRARNLLAAAREIVNQHGAQIPRDVESLLNLPGIGRYTAGAIASIAFDIPAPILDGNVARVLCRLDRIESNPGGAQTRSLLWERAAEVVPKTRPGDFNSAMMELGATVCTPRSPGCGQCPVQQHCQAFAAGVQELIPPKKKSAPTPLLRRSTYCISRGRRATMRWLIEQRPADGRWAGMWQFVTLQAGAAPPVPVDRPRHLGTIQHALTHRRYQIDVYLCRLRGRASAKPGSQPRRWVTLEDLHSYPLPRPHVRVAQMLKNLP